MKKLCLGTFLHIISQARGASVKQKNLVGALLRCVDCSEASFYADDDMRQGHLKNGRDNIPSYFADAVRAGNPDSIFSYFADVIHPMLDKNKERHVVLAFRNILEEDTDIADTINLGPVSGYTKADILTFTIHHCSHLALVLVMLSLKSASLRLIKPKWKEAGKLRLA